MHTNLEQLKTRNLAILGALFALLMPCCALMAQEQSLEVFDNGVTAFTNTTSETTDDDNARILAEDVIFDSVMTITRVQWSGQYTGSAPPATDNFSIEIYADSGNLPSGAPLAVFNVGNNVNRTLVVSSGEYDYSADIDFTMAAGVRYWISIHDQDTSNDMDFRWNATTDNGNAGVSFDGGASWNNDNENFDLTLLLTPVFDNGVTASTNTTSEITDDDNARILAEDVIFDSAMTVIRVEWSGQYAGSTAPATDNFSIEIYADSGDLPSGAPLAVFNVGNNVNRTLVISSGEYDYSAAIEFSMAAGVRYWISIHDQDTSNDMDFQWNATTDNGNAGVSFDGGASWNNDNENFDLTLYGTTSPANDFYDGPGLTLPFNETGTNVGASTEVGEQQLQNTGSTVWWFFTAAETGTVTVDTIGSSFDTQLHIYTGFGMGFANLIPVVNNDDFSGLQSQVTFAVEAGDCYDIRVGGFRPSPAFLAAEGIISLNGTFEPESKDILRGDLNLDNVVDLLDVQPFVDRILSGTFQDEADINGDGSVDLLDVQPFVDLLIG